MPNLLAGGLASTRSRLVAAVVPTIAGPVFLETVQSLTEALAERGYQLMLGQAGYAGGREDALLEAIIGRRPDGIVLTGIMHSAEGRRRLLASGIPVVETWDLTPTPIDMLVGFSHVEVGRAVASLLHGKGRRRLGRGGRRRRARAAPQRGLPGRGRSAGRCAESRVVDVPAPTTLKRGARRWPSCCASTRHRRRVLQLRPAGAGRDDRSAGARRARCREQLAVVGFGDLEFAADLDPALTTVRIKGAAIGRQAAQFIVDRAEGRDVPERGDRHRLLDRRARRAPDAG